MIAKRPKRGSIAELEKVASRWQVPFEQSDRALYAIMTEERCTYVRELRCDGQMKTWRAIASICHERWHSSGEALWEPVSSQIVGQGLCKIAALAHSENPTAFPWN